MSLNAAPRASQGSVTRWRQVLPALELRASVVSILIAAAMCSWPGARVQAHERERKAWIATWTGAPQPPTPSVPQFDNQTLRQIVHVSIGGPSLRVRFSNELGSVPLVIGAARVALQQSGANIVPATDRVLSFGGRTSVTIPVGAAMLSDAVMLHVPELSNLAISIYLPEPTLAETIHAFNHHDTYVSPPGDFTSMPMLPTSLARRTWHFLTGVNVAAPHDSAAIVVLGDSIAEAFAAAATTNRRWPQLLAQRVFMRKLSVASQAISGNSLLGDEVGPSALARFDRDVLAVADVHYLVVHLGIFDIIAGRPAEDIITAYRQLTARARTQGLRILGATVTPFEGHSQYNFEREVTRQTVNNWLRTALEVDRVLDFDGKLRDPQRPSRLLPIYDAGDHLHLTDSGAQVLADSIDVRWFDERN